MIDWNGIKTQPPQHNPEVTEASQTPHRTLITADGWKLTLGDPEHGELYDLNTDPHEMNNLYDDPAQSDRIHDLVGSIRTWQGGDRGHPHSACAVGWGRRYRPGGACGLNAN